MFQRQIKEYEILYLEVGIHNVKPRIQTLHGAR